MTKVLMQLMMATKGNNGENPIKGEDISDQLLTWPPSPRCGWSWASRFPPLSRDCDDHDEETDDLDDGNKGGDDDD